MAVIIGGGDNAYFFNPENPRDTSNKVNPNTGVTYSMSGNIHSNDPVEMVRNEPFIPGPASPAPEDQLQFLIDNKNKLTGIQGVNPELNAYQEAIQNFRTSDPMNMAAYADRFPLTNFMMTAPNKIAENTLFGQVLSAMNTGKDKAKEFASGLFPQGFMPGLGQTFSDIKEDAKNVIPAATKDLNTFTGLFRNITDTKKNTAEDIAPGVLTETSPIKTEGTPISQALSGNVDLSRFIDPNTGRVPAELTLDGKEREVKDQFRGLNLGQLQNLIRDESGYFDRVIQQLGLGGR